MREIEKLLRENIPLIFIKQETTGIDVKTDKIVEIYMKKFQMTNEGLKTSEYHTLINPEIKISSEASKIHGHTEESLKSCPTFNTCANDIYEFIN